MDKFEKALLKSANEALKELKKEKLMESDWAVDSVSYSKLADDADPAPPHAHITRVACRVHARRNKAEGEAEFKFELPLNPETPATAKRLMVEQYRKLKLQGVPEAPGGVDEDTNP